MHSVLRCMAVVGTCALLAGCAVKSNTTNINEPEEETATETDDKSSGTETPAGDDKESGIPEGGTPRSGLEPPSTPTSSGDKPAADGPGKSETAPGHDPKGPGNSENAPGHNKESKDPKAQGKTTNKPTVDTNKESGTSGSGKTPGTPAKK